jgi:hypothetical protein
MTTSTWGEVCLCLDRWERTRVSVRERRVDSLRETLVSQVSVLTLMSLLCSA